jgi:hypothetical protein
VKKNSYVDLSAAYNIEWQELQCYAIGQKSDAYLLSRPLRHVNPSDTQIGIGCRL